MRQGPLVGSRVASGWQRFAIGALALTGLAAGARAEPAALCAGRGTPAQREAVALMARALDPRAGDEQRAAALAAALPGQRLLVQPLLHLLRGVHPPVVRAAASAALARIGIPARSEELIWLLEELLKATRDSEPLVVEAAFAALGRLPFPEVKRHLREAASGDGDLRVRRLATQALAAHAGPVARDNLLRSLDLDAGPEAHAGPDGWTDSVDAAILASLAPYDAARRHAVLRDLATCPHGELVPFLLAGLHEPAEDLQAQLLAALGARQDPSLTRYVARGLQSTQRRLRLVAAQALAGDPGELATAFLLGQLLYEGDWQVQEWLLRLLAARPTEQLVTQAIEQQGGGLVTTATAVLRLLQVLSGREDERLAGLLVELLRRWYGQPGVVQALEQRLAALPDEQVVPELVWLLAERHPALTVSARLLGARRDARLAAALAALGADGASHLGDHELRWLLARQGCPALVQPGAEALARVAGRLEDPSTAMLESPTIELLVTALDGCTDPGLIAPLAQLLLLPLTTSAAQGAAALLVRQDPARLYGALGALARPDTPAAGQRLIATYLAAPAGQALTAEALAPFASAARAWLQAAPPPGSVDESAPHPGRLVADLAARLADAEPAAAAALRVELVEQQAAPADLRAAALTDLAASQAPQAMPLALRLADDPEPRLMAAARAALHALDPGRYKPWDRLGRWPLIGSSALFGGTAFAIAADLGSERINKTASFIGGGVLGAAVPFLLTLERDVTLGEFGYFSTVGLLGTLGGYGTALALDAGRAGRSWWTLGGQAAGLALAGLTVGQSTWSIADALLVGAMAAEGALACYTITGLGDEAAVARWQPAATALGAVTVGAGFSLWTTRLDLGAHSVPGIGALALTGSFLGPLAAGALRETPTLADRIGGVLFGQAAGTLLAVGLDPWLRVSWSHAGWLLGGLAAGSAFGYGGGLILSSTFAPEARAHARHAALAGEVGGLAGIAALGLLGARLRFSENDAVLVLAGPLGGALAGAFSADWLGTGQASWDNPAVRGGAMLGASLGLAAGLTASQLVDISDRQLVMMASGGGLSLGLAVGGRNLVPALHVREGRYLVSALAVSGTVAAGLLSGSLSFSDPDLALQATSAALGLGWGLLLPGYVAAPHGAAAATVLEAAPRSPAAWAGALAGASGLALGSVLATQLIELEGSDVGKLALNTAGASLAAAGLGLMTHWEVRWQAALVHGAGLLAYGGTLVRERGPAGEPDWAKRSLGLLGAAHGLAHGLLIPLAWRERPHGRELLGGALLGTGVGYAALRLAGLALPVPEVADTIELSSYGWLAALAAGGVAQVAEASAAASASAAHLGAALGLGAGWALAPRTTWDSEGMQLLAVGAGAGLWHGYWLAAALGHPAEDHQRTGAGLYGGLAAGTLLAAGLAQTMRPPAGAAWSALAFDLAVSSLVAGVQEYRGRYHSAQTGQWLSAAAGGGALLAGGFGLLPWLRFTDEDLWLMATLTGLGAAQGTLVPQTWPGAPARPQERRGGALVGVGGGLLLGGAMAQLGRWELDELAEGSLLWATGLGLAAGVEWLRAGSLTPTGGSALDDQREGGALRRMLTLHGGAALGLAFGLGLAERTSYEGEDLLLAITLAAAGGLQGMLLPALWPRAPGVVSGSEEQGEHDQMRATAMRYGGGLLAGALAGHVTALALGQFCDLAPGDQFEALTYYALAHGVAGGAGLLAVEWDGRQRATASQVAGLLGITGGLALAPHTTYQDEALPLAFAAGAVGAWQGLWIGRLWRDPLAAPGSRAAISGREYGGGLLFGASLGLGVGLLASQAEAVRRLELSEVLFVTASAYGLGAGLGQLVSADERWAWGLMEAAGLLGLAGGALGASATSYSAGDRWALGLAGTSAALLGLQGEALVTGSPLAWNRWSRGGLLAGAGLGLLGGAAVSQLVAPAVDEVIEAGLYAATGVGFGLSYDALAGGLGQRGRLLLANGLGLAGLATGAAFAPATRFDGSAPLLIASYASLGAGLGAFLPLLVYAAPDQAPSGAVTGGLLGGALFGVASGAALSQLIERAPGDILELTLGGAGGAMTGAGIGLLASEGDRLAAGLLQLGGLAGTAAITALAPATSYGLKDSALGTLGLGYGVWNGAGLALLLDASERQVAGATLMVAGLGGLGGAWLSQTLRLDWTDLLTVFAGSVWGTWIGAWSGVALERRVELERGRLLAGTTAIGSDLGMLFGGLLISRLTSAPPVRFAWINVAGGAGLLLGLMVGGVAEPVGKSGGIAAGSALGLAAGYAVTAAFDWQEEPEPSAAATPAPAPAPSLAHLEGLLAVPGLSVVGAVPGLMPLPPLRPDQPSPGVLLTVSGLLR